MLLHCARRNTVYRGRRFRHFADFGLPEGITHHPVAIVQSAQPMGLTGFDVSFGGRACDPSCSDSINGAKNTTANTQFAVAA
ncbi:MAG: hypothetical protein RL219_1205 [Actinomycetota bacterium]